MEAETSPAIGVILSIVALDPGRNITPWLIAWGMGLTAIIPWPLWSIVPTRREDWFDIAVARDPNPPLVEES